TPEAPDSRPSASGNEPSAEDPDPIVPGYYEISGAPMRRSARAPRPAKRYESKDVFIGQNYPVDMARKKLDAQNAALKKELACALAPTTMKASIISDEGVVAAGSHPSQKAREGGPPTHPSQNAREGEASTTHPSQKTRKGGPPPAEAGTQLDY